MSLTFHSLPFHFCFSSWCFWKISWGWHLWTMIWVRCWRVGTTVWTQFCFNFYCLWWFWKNGHLGWKSSFFCGCHQTFLKYWRSRLSSSSSWIFSGRRSYVWHPRSCRWILGDRDYWKRELFLQTLLIWGITIPRVFVLRTSFTLINIFINIRFGFYYVRREITLGFGCGAGGIFFGMRFRKGRFGCWEIFGLVFILGKNCRVLGLGSFCFVCRCWFIFPVSIFQEVLRFIFFASAILVTF